MACPTKRVGCVDFSWCCRRRDKFQTVKRHPPSSQPLCQLTRTRRRTAVSESSYLPFLFHTEDKVSSSFNGRRSFAKGKAVVPVCFTFFSYPAVCDHATNPPFHSASSQYPEPAHSSDPPQTTVAKHEPDSVSGGSGAGHSRRDDTLTKSKREGKPVSISGFKSSPLSTSSTSRLPGKKPALPASDLIYQDADVGIDLGTTRRAARDRASFIKPADVDAPPRKSAVLSIVESARARVEQKKRSIDGTGSSAQFVGVPEESSRKKRKR